MGQTVITAKHFQLERPWWESLLFPAGAALTLLLLVWSPAMLPQSVQIMVLLALVVVLGLPHGALDPWIAQSSGLIQGRAQTFLFNLLYVAVAACVVAVWWLAPGLSLLVFLGISAWHFSGDWQSELPAWIRLPAGAMLILMPIGFHPEIVSELFSLLSGQAGQRVAELLSWPRLGMHAVMLALITAALLRQQGWPAAELTLLWALAVTAPPLIYFAVYFCLQHSPRHLLMHFREAGPHHHHRLLAMATLYTVGSVVLLLPLVWLWSDQALDALLMRLIFIGLAALTVPHMMLMVMAALKQRRDAI